MSSKGRSLIFFASNFILKDDEDPVKLTRFADGTNLEGSDKPGVVARDHSLGREYLDPDEGMTIEGFSWQEPVRGNIGLERAGSQSSYGPPQMSFNGPGSRMGSYSSIGPPPPPGPYDRVASSERHQQYAAWGRTESWGSIPVGGPPPSMGFFGYPGAHPGSWARDHSLGAIPLRHASVSQSAYPAAFDHGRNSSGHWGPPYPSYPPMMEGPPHPSGGYHHGPPPPQESPSPRRESSGSLPLAAPPSPTYTVDPAVASQWSGRDPGEIAITMSGGSSGEEHDIFKSSLATIHRKTGPTPKPDLVKRATSNQNETVDTKPDFDGHSVKRAALNRDSSSAANRLKAKYMPEYFDAKTEVELLSSNFKQSTLKTDVPKPTQYSKEDRMMTLDIKSLDLVIKPASLRLSSRSTTIEALALDFDDDDPFVVDRSLSSIDDMFLEAKENGVARPPALSAGQRLSTSDMFDIGT